jgi:hypothetical protein
MTDSNSVKIARMEEKINSVQESIATIKSLLQEHIEEQRRQFLSLDDKFAGKWTEVALRWLVGALGVSTMGVITWFISEVFFNIFTHKSI